MSVALHKSMIALRWAMPRQRRLLSNSCGVARVVTMRNVNKMRLSPVLVAVLAIASPLGSCESANAQTANSLKQTTKIFTLGTNQQAEKGTAQTHFSQNLESHPNTTGIPNSEYLKSQSVKALRVNSASLTLPEVVVLTSTTSTMAQTLQRNLNLTQQKTPSPSPSTTPGGENVKLLPAVTPVSPTTPGNI